jgi:hypothetical protein
MYLAVDSDKSLWNRRRFSPGNMGRCPPAVKSRSRHLGGPGRSGALQRGARQGFSVAGDYGPKSEDNPTLLPRGHVRAIMDYWFPVCRHKISAPKHRVRRAGLRADICNGTSLVFSASPTVSLPAGAGDGADCCEKCRISQSQPGNREQGPTADWACQPVAEALRSCASPAGLRVRSGPAARHTSAQTPPLRAPAGS